MNRVAAPGACAALLAGADVAAAHARAQPQVSFLQHARRRIASD